MPQKETAASKQAFDADDFVGTYEDLISEGIDDQAELVETLSGIDITSRLDSVTVQTSEGAVPMSSDIDTAIEAMRKQVQAESEMQELQVNEALPNLRSMALPTPTAANRASSPSTPQKQIVSEDAAPSISLPVLSGRMPSSSATAAGTTASPFAVATAPSSSTSAARTTKLSFDDDLAWLQ